MEIAIFVTWLVLALAVAQFAKNKGNSPIAAFLVAILLSPLIGLILTAIASPNEEKIEESKLESGKMKKCPYCAELIKIDARVCRFCGKDVLVFQKPTQTTHSFLTHTTTQIWTTTEGVKSGPFSMAKLKQLWEDGSLTLDTTYWTQGMSEWRPVEELFQSLE
jgi:hypothetical protein